MVSTQVHTGDIPSLAIDLHVHTKIYRGEGERNSRCGRGVAVGEKWKAFLDLGGTVPPTFLIVP